ncbi:MAG TPA: FAD binding domain-containing protein, partial [Pseudonocardia sp.]|nr:FAD binding domain-containing protein [Pseudonocardia sp.]
GSGSAKVLAGGQSLVPVLAMRLGRPGTLVDINSVAELSELRQVGGALRIGATVRQRALEHSAEVAEVPLLGLALPFVGHRELRSRGTVCGSLAHADPAAELPAVACCLGAVLEVAGPAGRRRVSAEQFFAGAMTTAVGPDEVLVAAEFPVPGAGSVPGGEFAVPGERSVPGGAGEGFGFAEVARRHGDFALAGVAARVVVAEGRLAAATLTGFGISDRPVTRDVVELLRAADGVPAALREATAELAAEVVDTAGDAHGSTGYRRRLFGVLAARELTRAAARAHAHADYPGHPS